MKLILYYFLFLLVLGPFVDCKTNELAILKRKFAAEAPAGKDLRDSAENFNYISKDKNEYNNEQNKNKKVYAPIKNVLIPALQDSSDPLYWSGWIKYFHYEGNNDLSAPTNFYENPDYFTQKVFDRDYMNKDEKIRRVYIPTKNHFWAQLLSSGNFNILGSRKNSNDPQANTVENLNTDLITHIVKDDNASGGVQDLGNFHEGSCIKVTVKRPEAKSNPLYNPRTMIGEKEVWIICTDKEEEKKKLMGFLIAIKLRRQDFLKDDLMLVSKPILSADQIMVGKHMGPVIVKYKGKDASPDDGYWILLQDWSDCSLKCGGGTQLQQWMCVPAKNKGMPCLGEPIRKRKCNNQPCPSVKKDGPLIAPMKNVVTLTPIYKAMPYSQRPQQYIKCVIKENDVLYQTTEFDPEKKEKTKIPGRIVMNTKTISVFRDESYKTALFNFNLGDTNASISKSDFCCFYLTNANRQFEVCGFNNNCGTPTNPIWVNTWIRDLQYFKTKCFEELNELTLKLPAPPKTTKPGVPQPGIGIPLGEGIVESRKQVIEKVIEEEETNELEKKIGETQKVALTALRREINLEDLIKNEEIQKGRDSNAELFRQVEQEKKKKNLLTKALQFRESTYAKIRDAKATKLQIDNIKKDAKVDIKFKRAVLKKKIEEIRNKFKRKNRLLQQQVQLIRSEMAEEIMNANKKGNAENCNIRNDIAKIASYCDKWVADDYTKNRNCKDPANFCYACCETEFGNMYISQRDECQTMCDELDQKDLSDGDWIWEKASS